MKEWIKVRLLFWIPFAALAAALCDVSLMYKGFVAMHGAPALWYELIVKQTVHFSRLSWVLAAAGMFFAALQFVPECSGRRLRLMFHLPVSYRVSMYTAVGYGLLLNLALLCAAVGGLALVFARMGFPRELALPMLGTLPPWGLAGFASYCSTAAVLAEPRPARAILFGLLGFGYVTLLTAGNGYSPLGGNMWPYVLACLLWPLALESAALRVKEGQR
jgi:hypothetical protein